jgi:hypothetical protein
MERTIEPQTHEEDPAYKAAVVRAEMLQGYYIHLLVYAVVNSGLFLVNSFTKGDDGGWWFVWPLAGWGVGLVIHTLATFSGVFSEGWKERKAAEIYRRRRVGGS